MTQPLSIEPGTPLPWATTKRNPRKVTADGVLICTAVIRNMGTTRQNKNGKGEEAAAANAAYIVHAANNYPQLFDALSEAVAATNDKAFENDAERWEAIVVKMNFALVQAGASK